MLFQEVFVNSFNASRTSRCLDLCLSGNTVHAVLAILLGTEVLTLLIGFLLLHHLHYLGISFGKINGRGYFQSEVVEVVLIVVLELLHHSHALLLGQRGIVERFLVCFQWLHHVLDVLLRLGKRLAQFFLTLLFGFGSFVGSHAIFHKNGDESRQCRQNTHYPVAVDGRAECFGCARSSLDFNIDCAECLTQRDNATTQLTDA